MKCSQCGFNNSDEAKFCQVCGFELSKKEESTTDSSAGLDDPREAGPIFQERNDAICPFCGAEGCLPTQKSTTEIKSQGYKWGSGCCGMFLLGPFGLLCGLCGTGSKTKIENELWWTCTKCGKQHVALDDALKKYDLFIAKLIPSSISSGISIIIEKLIFKWLLGYVFGYGFITSAIVFLVPFFMVYAVIKEGWGEFERELSKELGKSIVPYLNEEQRKNRDMYKLIGIGIMLFIGLFGIPILDLILGE